MNVEGFDGLSLTWISEGHGDQQILILGILSLKEMEVTTPLEKVFWDKGRYQSEKRLFTRFLAIMMVLY